MSQFIAQIRIRTQDALTSLHEAQAADDLHLMGVRTGELESLARTAAEHDVDVPELRPHLRSTA